MNVLRRPTVLRALAPTLCVRSLCGMQSESGAQIDKDAVREGLATFLSEFQRVGANESFAGQSEATTRTWIERFLQIFGWDPGDPRQVVQEFRIGRRDAAKLERAGSSHRRPDYALIVNDRPILYIDAKRIDVDIEHDEGVAFQVRSYGWSAGFRLSYAFDVQELAIYDCFPKPDQSDDARVARLFYARHTEFLERFDTLWDYFGRSAIRAGSLQTRHPDDQRPRGSVRLDEDFEAKLSEWRCGLAKSMLRVGLTRNPAELSAAAQRILDRIVFLRLCEAIGLEPEGRLNTLALAEHGFWHAFMEEHERYRRAYDGILFPAMPEDDPTGVEALLCERWLKGKVFGEIVDGLYYPQPYKFDVVPLELLGGIYERYLGKRLVVAGRDVSDEFKPEYQRTKGAVYTPPWVVGRVISRTLEPLMKGRAPEEILQLRVLDPACGSGSFLLGVYDYFERTLLDWAALHPSEAKAQRIVERHVGADRLTREVARRIIDGCLFGVDIDAEAIEITRMSLALRFVERTVDLDHGPPVNLLQGIGRNIRHGNSIVGPDFAGLGLDPQSLRETMPFDWHSPKHGFGMVLVAGGFDAVVGNPPYIEVKRYREWMPAMYRYLKEQAFYVTAKEGKTDIAIPFIERAVGLLKPHGRLGFIVQNRFFKTDYGRQARAWLRTQCLLEEIDDFRDLQIFAGRTTYTSILVLQRGSPRFRYRTYANLITAQAGEPSVDQSIAVADIDDEVWSFEQPDLLDLHNRLARRHGTLGEHREISISVGLQTLYGKLYQLAPTEVRARNVRGVNGLGQEVELERKALRPLCRNRGFFPFRRDNADAWVIFPYDVKRGVAHEIEWRAFDKRFPKAADYLYRNRDTLQKAVETESGEARWHLYTRPQNLVAQSRPKVLFPSTIEDTLASADLDGDVYQDNVRINSLSIDGPPELLLTIAAVMNSSLFSALARVKAGLSDGGWRQFNRQYAELVPLPLARLRLPQWQDALAKIATRIQGLQDEWLSVEIEGERGSLAAALERAWTDLDRHVEELYELEDADREIARRYPRIVDRVSLIQRQTRTSDSEPPDDE